jgi:hypothetical protein
MVKEIPLISSKYPNKVALVDDEDYEKLIKYKWYVRYHHRNFYAQRLQYSEIDKKNHFIMLHREILGTAKGVEVDHKDHNELNCQKWNMRECSHFGNMRNARKRIPKVKRNTSKYKGVSFKKDGDRINRWRAQIRVNGKDKLLGHFFTEIEAALAYDAGARQYYKEFACTNFEHLTKDNLYDTMIKLKKKVLLQNEEKG